jgi:hypothetical protein
VDERRGKYVEAGAERGCGSIEAGRIEVPPIPRIEPLDQGVQGRDGLGRRKGAVSGSVDEDLAKQPRVVGILDR